MIKLFFKIYNIIYINYMRVFYHKQFKLHGRIKANRFFRIELSRNAKLEIKGTLDIKENVLFAVRKNAKLEIGENCFFNRNCSVVVRESVKIGNNCMFGENVKIYDNDHLIRNGKIFQDKYLTKEIIISPNCWIANDVNILKGSTLPKGCVIAAMSLVKFSLSESGIYAGIPVSLKKGFN